MLDKQAIKKLRKSYGLSRKELGALVGISESAIYSLESGRRGPGIKVEEALGEFFAKRIMAESIRNFLNSWFFLEEC